MQTPPHHPRPQSVTREKDLGVEATTIWITVTVLVTPPPPPLPTAGLELSLSFVTRL
jgi:hypothetical protein